VIKVNREFE
jgi:hypothetical protein